MSIYLDTSGIQTNGSGRRHRRVTHRRVMGRGFWGSLWNGVKSVAPSVLRSTGVLSKAANLIPYVGAPASALIRSQGYGRRRVRRRVGGATGGKRRVVRRRRY